MIKNHLSKLLGIRRISQRSLSRLTGIRYATINEMYNEWTERYNAEHLDRICEVLECPLSDLIEYIPNKNSRTGKNLIIEQNGNRKDHQ